MAAKKPPALGRGLDALLGSAGAKPGPRHSPLNTSATPSRDESSPLRQIPIEQLHPNPYQPRRTFDEDKLDDLAASIKNQGILQPIVVRKKDNRFEIVAGERRWRAAQRSGLREIPAMVKQLDDRTMTQVAIIENVQRENLNAVEEAQGYERLGKDFDLTQEQIAQAVGKSRVSITNSLRLLKLQTSILDLIKDDKLSAGHARALLAIDSGPARLVLAEIIRDGLSVRQTEREAKPKTHTAPTSTQKTATHEFSDLQEKLSLALGMKVKINPKTSTTGKIEFQYGSLADFERFCETIGLDPSD